MLNRNLFLLTCGGGNNLQELVWLISLFYLHMFLANHLHLKEGKKKEEKRSEGQITSE